MILFKLLALPITAPAAGIKFCIEKVIEYAEHETNDEGLVREQLLELQIGRASCRERVYDDV